LKLNGTIIPFKKVKGKKKEKRKKKERKKKE
jgi:hypothetical protein